VGDSNPSKTLVKRNRQVISAHHHILWLASSHPQDSAFPLIPSTTSRLLIIQIQKVWIWWVRSWYSHCARQRLKVGGTGEGYLPIRLPAKLDFQSLSIKWVAHTHLMSVTPTVYLSLSWSRNEHCSTEKKHK